MTKKQIEKYMKERTKPFIYDGKLYLSYSYIETIYKDKKSLKEGIYELKEYIERGI